MDPWEYQGIWVNLPLGPKELLLNLTASPYNNTNIMNIPRYFDKSEAFIWLGNRYGGKSSSVMISSSILS